MMDKKVGPELQQRYKEYISQKRFAELARLIEKSKTKPPEYIARMGYKSYMEEPQGRKVKLFYIIKLKELTGVIPGKDILKEICEISLKMDSPEPLEALIKRVGIEKDILREMESVIQKTYTDYVAEGKFVDISKLMELTDVTPHEEIIQKGYESYLEEGKFISFAGLKKRTGIPPDQEMVQDMYRQYHFNYMKYKKIANEKAEEWSDRFKKLKRLSKIDPEGIAIEEEAEEGEEKPEENPAPDEKEEE